MSISLDVIPFAVISSSLKANISFANAILFFILSPTKAEKSVNFSLTISALPENQFLTFIQPFDTLLSI